MYTHSHPHPHAHAHAHAHAHTNLWWVAGRMRVVHVYSCAWQNHSTLRQEMRGFFPGGVRVGWGGGYQCTTFSALRRELSPFLKNPPRPFFDRSSSVLTVRQEAKTASGTVNNNRHKNKLNNNNKDNTNQDLLWIQKPLCPPIKCHTKM